MFFPTTADLISKANELPNRCRVLANGMDFVPWRKSAPLHLDTLNGLPPRQRLRIHQPETSLPCLLHRIAGTTPLPISLAACMLHHVPSRPHLNVMPAHPLHHLAKSYHHGWPRVLREPVTAAQNPWCQEHSLPTSIAKASGFSRQETFSHAAFTSWRMQPSQ